MAPVDIPHSCLQLVLPLLPVGHNAVEDVPERWRVMRLKQVREFMRDNVVHEPYGQLQESPVEKEGPATAARTPAESQVSHPDAGWRYPGSTREKLHPPRNPFSAFSDIPAPEVLGCLRRRIFPQAEASAVEHQRVRLHGDDNQPIWPP